MSVLSLTGLFLFSLFICFSATGITLKYLRQKAILDHPNERSSHVIPTPRGGGIGVMIAVILSFVLSLYLFESPTPRIFIPLAATLILAILSWADDLFTLGAGVRFLVQILITSVCVYTLPEPPNGYLGGVLPLWLEKVFLLLGWVWFMNLFNFMDGIDGISGVEIFSIGTGLVFFSIFLPLPTENMAFGIILAGASLGFLMWNWHPAKVFMGDVGSIPMGFLIGWLLINLAGNGFWVLGVLLPLYYLTDATYTLTKRLIKKEKIWEAHRQHFYQQATQNGLRHDQVSLRILFANMGLIGAGWICYQINLYVGIIVGIMIIVLILYHFSQIKGQHG